MNCREFIDFLIDYHDGALPPCERALFDAHIKCCPNCVHYLHDYALTVKMEKAAFTHPDDPVPDEVPEGLVQAILAARAGHSGPCPS